MRIFDDELKAAMFEMNALAAKYDARVLAAACMCKGAYLYQQLRMLGHETPETLPRIFAGYLKLTLEDGEPARILSEADMVTASAGGKPN